MEFLSIDVLLLFIIGVLAAIIGVMFGAAGFVLLPALLLFGIPIHATIAGNKFATGLSSLSAVLVLLIKKKVQLTQMLPLMFLAGLGGISGAFIATRLSELMMNIIACIVLITMFIFVLKTNKTKWAHDQQDMKQQNEKQKTALLPAFFIGIYDGGFGPGSALLNTTYFLKNQFSYLKAAEMTRFLMFASCISAFCFYFFYGGIVDWSVIIPITAGSIVGSHMGLKFIPYIKGQWIRILLPAIFFLLIVQVVADLLF